MSTTPPCLLANSFLRGKITFDVFKKIYKEVVFTAEQAWGFQFQLGVACSIDRKNLKKKNLEKKYLLLETHSMQLEQQILLMKFQLYYMNLIKF